LDFASTFVPIIDCTDAVAWKTAAKYGVMLASPNLKDLQDGAKEQMFQLKQEHVRRAQGVEYHRIPFANQNGSGFFANDSFGWQ
jgi:hypothetical protein